MEWKEISDDFNTSSEAIRKAYSSYKVIKPLNT